MLEAIATGLLALLTPQAVLFMLIGSVYGLIVGILPGLGGIVAMTLLLPFTFGYELAATLALLLGAHIGTIWGSSVTSILFNVPGAAKSLPLIFDGYPMTLKGEAERALGASAMAALLGGVFGAIFLAICIPVVRPLILALGPAEYLMMAFWGMTLIATFSDGSLLKGLIAACVGVLIAFINMGIAPGPQMLSEHLDVVFTLVWIVVIASIVTSGIGLLISPWLARMPTLKGNLVIPIVLCVCFLGAFATRGRLADVAVAAIFGVLGYFMDKYRFSRANLVIGMVLATMIERSLHVSLSLYGGDFLLERPIALAMLALIVLTTAWPFVRSRRQRAAPAIERGRP